MKTRNRLGVSSLLLITTWSGFAADVDLDTHLVNLGEYMGYDLNTPPSTMPLTTLLNPGATQKIQLYLFNTALGALLVNTSNTELETFVPANQVPYAPINYFANHTFANPAYNQPSEQGTVAINALLDQQPYQTDPTNQTILNMLGAPDVSYCLYNNGTAQPPAECNNLLTQDKVITNVIGELPTTDQFFTFKYNQPIIPQLNSNTLLSPLLYSTTAAAATATSSNNNSQQKGLTAQSQAQDAANFIRYAAATILPLDLPTQQIYNDLYMSASIKVNSDTSAADQIRQREAQTKLAAYFLNLRIYTAQVSVGISNLYYLLSKRLPQAPITAGSPVTSQALNEFTMATWRLFNPTDTGGQTWLMKINQASDSTVQKEIATLLAEINYQLYLSRQQQERLLLTNSTLLLESSHANRPTLRVNAP